MNSPRKVLLNGAFIDQPVTGQQRYAREIARALECEPALSIRTLKPRGWWSKSPIRVWLWVQFLGVRLRKGEFLLTLTSRGPVFAPRQIVTVHDRFVLTNPEWYSRKYAITHGIVLRLQIRNANAILVVSQPVGEQLPGKVLASKRVEVVPNAPADVFHRHYSSDEIEKTLTDYGLVHRKYVLSVATVDPRKNIERLIAAHRALPLAMRLDHPLVLVGSGNKHFGSVSIDEYEGLVQLGYIDDESLAHLYAGSTAVAFPSLAEGFGLPAVEALATGANLIVSDIEVLRWVCGPHASYVDAQSVDSIKNALAEIADVAEHSDEARNDRRKYVAARFSWQESGRRVASLVHSLSSEARS